MFSFLSRSSGLKVPTVFVKSDNFETMPEGIIKRSWVITRTVQMAVWDKTEGNLSLFSLECFWMLDLTVPSSSNTASKSMKSLPLSLLSHLETQLDPPPPHFPHRYIDFATRKVDHNIINCTVKPLWSSHQSISWNLLPLFTVNLTSIQQSASINRMWSPFGFPKRLILLYLPLLNRYLVT